MEVNQLPTKPGPYYWRKSDEDEWARVFNVRLSNSIGLCVDEGFYHESVEHRGGQWLPIPAAEELVELQDCKKMVDEGQEAWGVYCPSGQLVLTGDKSDCEQQVDYMNDTDIFATHQKYTCEPVTIVRKAKR